MFLYLMDGCYDWWKEIMQKKFSSGGFICHGKREGRQSNCTTHEQEHWDFLTTGRFTRNSIPIATSGGEESLFEILRVTTAPSCMLHSTWSSLKTPCRPWPCSCLLCTLRSEMLWEQLLGNNLLWSRRENFSPFKENTSLENLPSFILTWFSFPWCC